MYLQIIRSFIANSIKIKFDGRSLVAVGADFSVGKYCFEFDDSGDSQTYHYSKPYSSYSEALKESRLYALKQFCMNCRAAIIVMNGDRKIVCTNKEASQLLGGSPVGISLSDLEKGKSQMEKWIDLDGHSFECQTDRCTIDDCSVIQFRQIRKSH